MPAPINPAKQAMDRILGVVSPYGANLSEPIGYDTAFKAPASASITSTSTAGTGPGPITTGGASTKGEVYDPYAEVNVELNALKQKNADFARSLGLSSSASVVPGAAVGSGGEGMHGDYLGYYNRNQWNEADLASPVAGQVEGGQMQGLFYSPTGGAGSFKSLTTEALKDPTVYANVKAMSTASGGRDPVGDKMWADWLAKGVAPVTKPKPKPKPKPEPVTAPPEPGPPGVTIY